MATLEPVIALAIAQARAQALEARLARAAEEIGARDVRLAELEQRLRVLVAQLRPNDVSASTADDAVATPPAWVRQKDLKPTEVGFSLELTGMLLGAGLGSDAASAFAECLPAVQLFCRIVGLKSQGYVRALAAGQPAAHVARQEGSWPVLSLGAGVSVQDVWFSGSHGLKLRLESRDPVVLRAWQYDLAGSGRLGLCVETLMPGRGGTIAELALFSPLLPVLLSISQPDGTLLSCAVLPFPSLCRGGMHYGETCAMDGHDSAFDVLRRLSKKLLDRLFAPGAERVARVKVDLSGAIGTEPMFSFDVQAWLACVTGVAVEPELGDSLPEGPQRSWLAEALAGPQLPAAFQQPRRTGGTTLMLPCDALPSLQALTAPVTADESGAARPASFIACDEGSQQPRWAVSLPQPVTALLPLQPAQVPGWPVLEGATIDPQLPLALRFCRAYPAGDSRLILPPGPAIAAHLREAAVGLHGRVSVVVAEEAPALGASLAFQSIAGETELIVETGEGTPAQRLARAARRATGDYLLVAHAALVLHDPHTVALLRQLASTEGVATAGCVLLAEALAKGKPTMTFQGGALNAVTSCFSPGQIIGRPLDLRGVLPFGTLPVLANEHLFMIRTEVLQGLGGLGDNEEALLELARRASQRGLQHLNTSATAASFCGQVADSTKAPFPIAPDFLGGACIIKELRP